MGFNVGGFAQGLQSGLGTGMAIRRNRQDERVRDVLARQMETQEIADREALEAVGGTYSEEGLDDPFFYRLLDWSRNRGSRRKALPSQQTAAPGMPTAPASSVPPTAAAGGGMRSDTMSMEDMASMEDQMYADGGMMKRRRALSYAEGGSVETEEDKIRRRAAENRARKPAQVTQRTESATNDTTRGRPSGPKPFRVPKYEGVGVDKLGGVTGEESGVRRALRRGKGFAKGAGIGYLAGATMGGAAEGYSTPTGEYAEQLGVKGDFDEGEVNKPLGFLTSPSFWRDAGVRTLGVMGNVGRAIMPDSLESAFGMRPRQALATGAQAPAPAQPPIAAPAGQGGGSTTAITRARGAVGAPAPAPAPAQQPQINLADVSPQEIPDFKVDDWTKHRELAVRQLVARGVPLGDAFEKVDQQVTATQQRGFTNFAMQGMALQEAGNVRGAMAAYRAAFQYFPSGTDVKFGLHKGQIVGIGVDEKTGKIVGAPMLLDSERIAALIDNFRKPEAWQMWAQDRRNFQQKMRAYEEVEKPQAEALSSAALTNAQANQTRAEADIISARSGGGSGVGSALAHERDAMRQLSDAFMEIEGVDGDPMIARSLASASMQIWKRYGGAQPWPTIVEAVGRAAQIQDPQQRAAFFARLGVVDPMGATAPQ